jgi:acyl-CoA reductase-like NAD-dependent aldehyde dehydrogenase
MYTQQLINGVWTDALDGGTWSLINPATEDEVASVAFGGAADALLAIDAASAALEAWTAMGAWARADIMSRAADIIEDRAEELARITTEESGKPLVQARGEWLGAPSYLRYAATEATRIGGRIIPSRAPGKRIDVTYSPIGVIGAIAAWNFPVYNVNRVVASSLAAGCTAVVRPSEYTPRSAFAYAKALTDAGVPSGVLNVINGDPEAMAQVMLDDPRVRKIQFTGSTRVGKILMDGASRTVTKLSLELGGNAPVIVMPDAGDIRRIASGGVATKYRNGGQVCTSPQRFLVHESVVGEFDAVATEASKAMRVGDPTQSNVDVGPMINATQRDRVERIVNQSIDGGARVTTGGARLDGAGYFFQPTVLSGDVEGTSVMSEEVFGPVLPIASFSDLNAAIELANSVEHGLASYVWTNDLRTAYEVSERLEYGMVGVNSWGVAAPEAPFGGVKQSGLGREASTEGIMEYLEPKTRFFGNMP